MAIKSSNQITFIEHKKIIEIKEWYLATSSSSGVTVETAGWTTSIQTIDYNKKYLWNYEEVVYSIGSSDISDPVIIGVYGEAGSSLQVKYISSSTVPVITNNNVSAWSDTVPLSVNGEKIYMIQKLSTDTKWSTPLQISAADGETPTITIVGGYWYVDGESTGIKANGVDGKGITNIQNYYATTKTSSAPNKNDWVLNKPTNDISAEYKYLWNYEVIIYTDGSTTSTDPAIIGVYGDSGENAIMFEIYSTHGFMFKEDLNSIEIKVAAFDGTDEISNATYSWYWWDDALNNGNGAYAEIIKNTSDKSFTVNVSDVYSFSSLKCVMNYNSKTYEDYVVLTNETVVYAAVTKFFNGSNIFTSADLYLVAYIDLYQNNHLIETIPTKAYCTGISSVSDSGIITAQTTNSASNGDKMYFVCKDGTSYKVILGQYSDNAWRVTDNKNSYTYTNSIYPSNKSNVIVISKEDINKSQNIDFTIYKDGTYIASTNAMVIDSNDPIVSDSEPENPVYNQLWLNTSTIPNSLKIFVQVDGQNYGKWIDCIEYLGGTVYTSKPSEYSVGDLWILATGETCGGFGPGSMLKATTTSRQFNASHWIDADAEYTELKNNIKQYFGFDPTTGLRIGQVDDKFYVNISSTEMGFYDNSQGQNQKVVSIGNNAATIKNITVEDSAEFNCNTTFKKNVRINSFVWQTESNGSFSLAVIK